LVRRDVFIPTEPVELRANPAPGLFAEQIRELDGARAGRALALIEPLRARAGRRHGKQLSGHIDETEQHRLPQLELRAEANHRMEDPGGQAATAALDEADMLRQPADLRVPRPQAPADPAPRIPPAVERRGARHARE